MSNRTTKTNKLIEKQVITATICVGLFFFMSNLVQAAPPNNNFNSITICHATSSESNPYETITINTQGQLNGHSNHNDDIIPAPAEGCPGGETEEPIDVCSNIEGDQEVTPEGYVNNDGICTIPEVPTDVCTNIEGNQEVTPEGYVNNNGICTIPEVPTDVCSNIEGNQAVTPEGYTNEDGFCFIPEIPTDVCSNIEGNQAVTPQGYVNNNGICTPDIEIPTETTESTQTVDVCPNLSGNQTVVPDDHHKEGDNCVEDSNDNNDDDDDGNDDDNSDDSSDNNGGIGGVLGASTTTVTQEGEVLGASTLGATGTTEENLVALTFILGLAFIAVGTRKYAPNKA